MNFAYDLRVARDNFLYEEAVRVADNVYMKLIQAAKQGFMKIRFEVDEDESHMRSQDFAYILSANLDGVKVKYEIKKYKGTFGFILTKHYLVYSWSEEV